MHPVPISFWMVTLFNWNAPLSTKVRGLQWWRGRGWEFVTLSTPFKSTSVHLDVARSNRKLPCQQILSLRVMFTVAQRISINQHITDQESMRPMFPITRSAQSLCWISHVSWTNCSFFSNATQTRIYICFDIFCFCAELQYLKCKL